MNVRSADTVQLIFVALTNILLITSLISLLSNSLTKVSTLSLNVMLGKIDWI
jgi:hypothetical protein